MSALTMEDRIKRINELYHKSQNEGLSDIEKVEQKRLRQEYIEAIRGSIRSQLDNIDIVEKDGTITSLADKKRKQE